MSALFHLYLCGRIAAEWLINMRINDNGILREMTQAEAQTMEQERQQLLNACPTLGQRLSALEQENEKMQPMLTALFSGTTESVHAGEPLWDQLYAYNARRKENEQHLNTLLQFLPKSRQGKPKHRLLRLFRKKV